MKTGYPHSGSLMARSYLTLGEIISEPQMGDIVVFWRLSKQSKAGHVGFYLGKAGDYVYCYGGNQSDKLKVSAYHKDEVLGYRRVKKLWEKEK